MSWLNGIGRLLPLLLVCAIWAHAQRADDALVFFGPRGYAHVLAARGHRTFWAFTTVSAGPQRAWSALVVSAPADLANATLAGCFGEDLTGETTEPSRYGFGINAART